MSGLRDTDGRWIQPSKLVDNDGNQIGTSSSPLIVTGSLGDVTLSVSDIEIGAVEIKNATTDDRVKVDTSGFLYTSGSQEIAISSSLATISTKDFSTETTLITLSASLSNIYDELKPSTNTNYSYTLYNSVAFESCSIVKASAGTLYGFSGYNSSSIDQFVLVFNSGSEAPVGSVPLFPVRISAGSNFSWDAGRFGIPMTTGITISNSSTASTLTSGSNDMWLIATYK